MQSLQVDRLAINGYNSCILLTIQKAFPILALSMFSAMLGMGIIVPFLPLYASEMGATGVQLGMIFAGYGIVNTIATPIMGRLSDLRGRKLFLCVGLVCYTIIALSYTIAASPLHLITIRFFQGAAGAMIMPISRAYIGDLTPEGEEGKWQGYSNACFFSGFGFGPLLGGVLMEYVGGNAAFFTFSGCCLLALLVAVPFLPESRQRKALEGGLLSFRETLKGMSASPMVKGLFTFRLVQALGRGSLTTFLPLFATTYAGLSPSFVGILMAANMLVTALFTIPAGRLADRFSRRAMIILGSFIYVISLVLIPMTHNFWQLILLCLPRGIGGAMSMTGTMALTVDEGRNFGMGTTMSVVMMAMGIGMSIGPVAAGVIYDALNINSVFFFGAIVTLIGTGLFAWLTR